MFVYGFCPIGILASSFLRLLEISQIGRQIDPSCVVFLAHSDNIVFAAILLGLSRPPICTAPIVLHHCPGPRQGRVDHRDFVMGHLGIGLVDVNPLLDDGFIVGVQQKAAAIERAGAFERSARLESSTSERPSPSVSIQ
jgi:hypothetical protein